MTGFCLARDPKVFFPRSSLLGFRQDGFKEIVLKEVCMYKGHIDWVNSPCCFAFGILLENFRENLGNLTVTRWHTHGHWFARVFSEVVSTWSGQSCHYPARPHLPMCSPQDPKEMEHFVARVAQDCLNNLHRADRQNQHGAGWKYSESEHPDLAAKSQVFFCYHVYSLEDIMVLLKMKHPQEP